MNEPETILSPKNPRILRAAGLKEKKARDEAGAYLAEGKRILKDLADPSFVAEIFVKEGKTDLLTLAKRYPCPVRIVSEGAFRKISDTVNGEGIVAVLKKRSEAAISGNRILVLDRVADPANAGTLLRSALAFGFNTVVSYESADFYNPKVVRGSMGAVAALQLLTAQKQDLAGLLTGFKVYAADMEGEELSDVAVPDRLALIVGNEARGISSEFVALATKFVKITMPGAMESLNAGVAGSIEMYYLK